MEAPLEKQGSMRVYNSHLMDSLLKDEDKAFDDRFNDAHRSPMALDGSDDDDDDDDPIVAEDPAAGTIGGGVEGGGDGKKKKKKKKRPRQRPKRGASKLATTRSNLYSIERNTCHPANYSRVVAESSLVVGPAAPSLRGTRWCPTPCSRRPARKDRTWDPTGGRTTDRSPVAPSSRPCTCTNPHRARGSSPCATWTPRRRRRASRTRGARGSPSSFSSPSPAACSVPRS
mmetsp:Transcript_13011/g.58709  ORF Transcript_13011/g.58709 Transcript_13011/m.58709 type:complete len:229 (+) Transcript_13011:49-735(+)